MTASLYLLLLWTWMALGAITFLYLLRVTAPFGRHTRPGWGPTLDNRLGWIIMEFTVVVTMYLTLGLDRLSGLSAPAALMMGLFTLHYVHRSLVFPFLLRTPGKRMPLAIVLSAIGFNLANGFFLGYYFRHFDDYTQAWFSDGRFIAGLLLFLFGMWVNLQSDYQLIRLRAPGETDYKIPRGKWFDYLSCPNHFGEILEWTGFALLTWSLPGLAFAFWTFANLAPRAVAHHRWYQQQFEDYPAERKAVLPYLW